MCWAEVAVGGAGHLERLKQSLLEELTTWKGKGAKWHIQPCEIPCPPSLLSPSLLCTSGPISCSPSASATTWTADESAYSSPKLYLQPPELQSCRPKCLLQTHHREFPWATNPTSSKLRCPPPHPLLSILHP